MLQSAFCTAPSIRRLSLAKGGSPGNFSLRVDGTEELARAAATAAEMVSKTALRAIHAEVVKPVVATAKVLARRKSGKMAGSIRPLPSSEAATVQAGGGRVVYAAAQHWGWPARNITANLFLSGALYGTQEEALEIYERELNKFIEQTWRSAG